MTFIWTCYILATLRHRSKTRLIYNNGNAFYSYKIGTMCKYNHPMIGLWAYTNRNDKSFLDYSHLTACVCDMSNVNRYDAQLCLLFIKLVYMCNYNHPMIGLWDYTNNLPLALRPITYISNAK